MRRLANKLCLVLIAIAAVAATGALGRAAEASLEYRVKAAFLYNFAKFVTWPPQTFAASGEPVVFCIVGPDPFEDLLDSTINGRRIDGRSITVRRVPPSANLAGCQLVFSSESDGVGTARVLQAAAVPHALTVGESEDFLAQGGMIRLLVDEGKVRFDISVRAAERAGIKLSSQLLKLARTVER